MFKYYRKTSRPKPINWEHFEQVTVVQYLERFYPGILFNADAGGLWTPFTQAKRMKAAGHKKGFPDLQVCEPRGKWHGLFIEMKTPGTNYCKKGKLSDSQHNWLVDLNNRGYSAYVCYGSGEAIKVIKKYLGLNARHL